MGQIINGERELNIPGDVVSKVGSLWVERYPYKWNNGGIDAVLLFALVCGIPSLNKDTLEVTSRPWAKRGSPEFRWTQKIARETGMETQVLVCAGMCFSRQVLNLISLNHKVK